MFDKIVAFLSNLFTSVFSIIKVLILSKFGIRFPISSPGTELFILVNGPSLKKSMQENFQKLMDSNLIVVNYFANSPEYSELRPSFYVINAKEMLKSYSGEPYDTNNRKLFNEIRSRTTWNIQLFIPAFGLKDRYWYDIISENKNIKINLYNTTPVEGFEFFRHFFFSLNLGMPRPHNVLIPSIMLGINMKFEEIYLLGADHSWIPEITVNEKNEVLVRQQHFYDIDSAKHSPMGNEVIGVRKLHDVLHKFYHTFHGYFIIKKYAESKGVKIYNSTPGSFIDAFERRKLN